MHKIHVTYEKTSLTYWLVGKHILFREMYTLHTPEGRVGDPRFVRLVPAPDGQEPTPYFNML